MTLKPLHPLKSQPLQLMVFTQGARELATCPDIIALATTIAVPAEPSVLSIAAAGAEVTAPPAADYVARPSPEFSLWYRNGARWRAAISSSACLDEVTFQLMTYVSEGGYDELRICSPGAPLPPLMDTAHIAPERPARRPLVTWLADLLRERIDRSAA